MRPTGFSSVVLALMLALASSGCSIGHVYRGSPLQGNPETDIIPGKTNRAEVLRAFGAPDRIVSRPAGDVFIYRFVREHSRSLNIEEPVFTNLQIFAYSVTEETEDRLVVLFDPQGTVESYGYLDAKPGTER